MPRASTGSGVVRLTDIPAFDTALAHELYEKLLAPAEAFLEGRRHVFVVADGALQSLPLGVLVSESPPEKTAGFAGYRDTPWLVKKYAFSTLPSVSSLRALRRFASATRAKAPFAGFGDPLLEGDTGGGRNVKLATLFARGPVADVTAIRALPRLPDTADELYAIAESVEADQNAVHLRERATETNVKAADLSNVRLLVFATHGLVAGDLKGVAEPALVLTPPAEGSETDDGLLTASEVAQLKLNADWVILSGPPIWSPSRWRAVRDWFSRCNSDFPGLLQGFFHI